MRIALALAVAVALLAGCGGDETSDYCESVKDHQRELSDIVASAEPGAIFDALDSYRELEEQAPRDLGDEWSQVIGRIEALESALDEADIDTSTYDPKTSLKQVPAAQRRAIEGAARDLGDEATVGAMAGIEQQALDVCKTPLSQ